eukprot:TRINITY_DN12070_c0_g1_i1.p1 TRINITY_DN12070_c0_g1~~TRINITY_DN12070_c0_g1_i1.p1  ORF type:complete len:309 (+),score=72.22 TRINITY_DN12070_c0_g1_i1:48-974(+)
MDKQVALQERLEVFNEMNKTSPSEWKNSFLCEVFTEVFEYTQYVASLKKMKVSGEKLIMNLNSKEKMKKLGITKLGHIKTIMKLIKKDEIGREDSIRLIEQKEDNKNKLFSLKNKKNSNNKNVKNNLKKDSRFRNVGDKVFQWSYIEINEWLRSIEMEEYQVLFRKHAIRGDILLDLDETHLKDMGIPFGNIKRILRSISKINPKEEDSKVISSASSKTKKDSSASNDKKHVLQWDVIDVLEWMRKIGFGLYCDNIYSQKIDGLVLMKINSTDLIEIGINPLGHRKKILAEIEKLKKPDVQRRKKYSI